MDKDRVVSVLTIGVVVVFVGMWGLKGCAKLSSNRDNVDTEKYFNVAMDENEDAISIALINSYSDYEGGCVQFQTQDNLIVLGSSKDTQLMRVSSWDKAYDYACVLAGGMEEKIISYDELQQQSTVVSNEDFTKNYFELTYDFDHALVKTNEVISIFEISEWKDWEDDDKVQFTTAEGNVVLRDFQDVKLINSASASEESITNYAISLAGSDERVFKEDSKVYRKQ